MTNVCASIYIYIYISYRICVLCGAFLRCHGWLSTHVQRQLHLSYHTRARETDMLLLISIIKLKCEGHDGNKSKWIEALILFVCQSRVETEWWMLGVEVNYVKRHEPILYAFLQKKFSWWWWLKWIQQKLAATCSFLNQLP